MDNTMSALGQEWITLQKLYERYEGGALLVKLVAVVLFFTGAVLGLEPWLACLVVLVLWLQEAIFKTYQSRLGERLLRLEQLLAGDPGAQQQGRAFQLHSAWLARGRSTTGLLGEYLKSACRPTVAFPYGVLLVTGLVLAWRG